MRKTLQEKFSTAFDNAEKDFTGGATSGAQMMRTQTLRNTDNAPDASLAMNRTQSKKKSLAKKRTQKKNEE